MEEHNQKKTPRRSKAAIARAERAKKKSAKECRIPLIGGRRQIGQFAIKCVMFVLVGYISFYAGRSGGTGATTAKQGVAPPKASKVAAAAAVKVQVQVKVSADEASKLEAEQAKAREYNIKSNKDIEAKRTKAAAEAASKAATKAKKAAAVAKKPIKYLTYTRNSGRVNNQLIAFASMLQHAHLMGRKLIMPPEVDIIQWTGLADPAYGLWDLTGLYENFELEYFNEEKYGKMTRAVPDKCKIMWDTPAPRSYVTLFDNTPPNWHLYDDCPMVQVDGTHSVLTCNQMKFCNGGHAEIERVAYKIYTNIKFHADILKQLSKEPIEIAVHSRTHGGKGDGTEHQGNSQKDLSGFDICEAGADKVLRAHINVPPNEQDRAFKMVHKQCYLWEKGALAMQNLELDKAKRQWFDERIVQDKPFFLADDQGKDWAPNADVRRNWAADKRGVPGPKVVTTRPIPRAPAGWFQPSREDIDRVANVLADIQGLVNAKYFIGNMYSSFSVTVCMMRGEERKADSNICRLLLHPETDKLNSMFFPQ